MKNFVTIVFALVMIISMASCTSIAFDPVIPGWDLPQPVEEDLLGHALRVSLMNKNWLPIEDDPGRITARYEKSGGVIAVDVEINYDNAGWTVTYVRSKNLDYNDRRSRIHKNYVRWVNNLNKGTYTEYMEKIGE